MDTQDSYVDVRETTTGVVILVRDRAYKIKKAISTAYLDFGSPAQREAALLRELELNRRMCPDVYLGVTHLNDPLDESIEPILVMARMPDDRRLSSMITSGQDVTDELHDIASAVSEFHRRAARGTWIDERATADSVGARWKTNLAELRKLCVGTVPGDTVDELENLAESFILGRTALFDKRIAAGHIVDGHGDLLSDDIFVLPDGPRILDCLDFDDRLRFVDTVDDASFLAMDLEFLGHEDLAGAFLTSMATMSQDRPPRALIDHYIAYRATVRAKVDALRMRQGDRGSVARLERHLALAYSHLRRAEVRLCLVGGLPGSGKSTLSAALAEYTGAVVVSSDRVRRELVDNGTLTGSVREYREGLYSPVAMDTVYSEMLTRAHEQLTRGQSVILDATWSDSKHRQQAEALAASTSSKLIEIYCSAALPVAVQRIAMRTESLSDATAATATAIERDHDPWPEAVSIDTNATVHVSVDAALDVWNSATKGP
ncbi:AAA family ATPase [Rhodococcus sp. IEGM 1379]|uniref:bifunctional aminoglycoside phosphotransferase/ATP-binding protein n=1 Tax=Rhodococcus sp. IEGM 1379 TaxID=3047086 RepID=UPI0024B774A3|nr:AAA family ATPase [Rhodococcus sp. IEGM 1379]MDI9914466.1 AAA family ATPase [Rhodococcus sp. IEGM 1379]